MTPGWPRWLRPALAVVPATFLVVFYVWPVLTLLATVGGEADVGAVLARPAVRDALRFTVWQALVSTAATLVAGIGPAFLLARWDFPLRRLLAAVVTVPFLLPTVVVGAAFTALLPDAMVGTASAVIVAHVFFNLAVVVRVVGAVWARLPEDLVAAARTLGATPWRATWAVTLPLLRPALTAAATIVFLFTFTSFGVVQILGGPANATLEVEIARRATQLGDVSGAAVLAVVQLVLLAVVLAAVAAGRRSVEVRVGSARRRRPAGTRQRAAVAVGAVTTAIVVLAPLVALGVASVRPGRAWSLRAWRTLGGDAALRPGARLGVDPLAAAATSLRIAFVATVASVLIGGLAALALAAGRRRGTVLDLGVMLPLGTSAVTLGFGILITFDRAPVDWRASWWLVPLGHALVAVPFVVRTVLPVLRSRPPALLDAAATLGAAPLRRWFEVDVRLAARPLVLAAGFAAAVSLGEFGATSVLTRTGQETLPIAIGRLLGRAGDIPRAQAAALSLVLAALTVAIIVAVERAADTSAAGGR